MNPFLDLPTLTGWVDTVETPMPHDLIKVFLALAAWFVVSRWLLPALGVGT